MKPFWGEQAQVKVGVSGFCSAIDQSLQPAYNLQEEMILDLFK